MKSNDRKSLSQLCTEMYDKPEDAIKETHNPKAINRDVNQQILDLLKSQGISEEEIQDFVNFVKTQRLNSPGDYESSDRFYPQEPQ